MKVLTNYTVCQQTKRSQSISAAVTHPRSGTLATDSQHLPCISSANGTLRKYRHCRCSSVCPVLGYNKLQPRFPSHHSTGGCCPSPVTTENFPLNWNSGGKNSQRGQTVQQEKETWKESLKSYQQNKSALSQLQERQIHYQGTYFAAYALDY